MFRIELHQDSYPEQIHGVIRDELRRVERERADRDAARRRRRERWAGMRARLARRPAA